MMDVLEMQWAILFLEGTSIGDVLDIRSSSTREMGMWVKVIAPTSKVYEYEVVVDVNELQLQFEMMRL